MKVLKSYLMAGDIWIFGVIIFCFLNRFVARVWYSWSLSQWTNDAEHALGSESSESQSSVFGRLSSLNNHYIIVQGLLVLYETMAYLIVCCIWVFYGRRASEKIQRKFITLITFAKACFFDTFVSFYLCHVFFLFLYDVLLLFLFQQNTTWKTHFSLFKRLRLFLSLSCFVFFLSFLICDIAFD